MEISDHVAMQRVDPLVKLPSVLAEFGVTIEDVLAGLPVAPADLRPGAYLPLHVCLDILDRAATASRCATIGLKLGAAQGFDAIGPLGHHMRQAESSARRWPIS